MSAETSMSSNTAVTLRTALSLALHAIGSGKNGLNAEAQRQIDIHSANKPKIELLQTIGTWLQRKKFGRRGVLTRNTIVTFLVLPTKYKAVDTALYFIRGNWYVRSGLALKPSDHHFYVFAKKLPTEQGAHEALSRITLDQIVKAWVIFAKEHDLQLPTDVTETPTGDFLLLKDRAAATDQRLR